MAIFIGWAGTFLAGGPSLQVARRLWAAMPAGSSFALLIGAHRRPRWHLSAPLGSSRVAGGVVLAVNTLVLNTALVHTGRTRRFSLVPGMSFGSRPASPLSPAGFGSPETTYGQHGFPRSS